MSKLFTKILASFSALAILVSVAGCSNSDESYDFEFLDGSLAFQMTGNWEYNSALSEAKTTDPTNELHTIYYYSNLVDYSVTSANLEFTYNPYEGMTVPEFVELTLSVRFPSANNPMDSETETHHDFGDVPQFEGMRLGKWYTSTTSDGVKRFFVEMVFELGFITVEFRTSDPSIEWDTDFRNTFLNSMKLEKSYFSTESATP